MRDEALKLLTDIREALEVFEKITQAPQIIGFRNRLIHGYDAVDHAIVWDVVKNKLPLLKAEVDSLLG